MIKYFGNQIIRGDIEYSYVISKRPDFKKDLDKFLKEHNRQDLIVEVQ